VDEMKQLMQHFHKSQSIQQFFPKKKHTVIWKKIINLLSLEAQATSLVRAGRPCQANNGRLLPILPAPHPLQEAHDIRLLLAP